VLGTALYEVAPVAPVLAALAAALTAWIFLWAMPAAWNRTTASQAAP
jgi:hypothetical protein